MRGSLQSEIAPIRTGNTSEFNTAKTVPSDAKPASDVDFLALLNNSNGDVKRQRDAKTMSGGELSGAENYEEFLEKLGDKEKKARTPKNNLDKDDFLKLFVTQLQNQDPLNPEDSSQMASQLAQFNSLEQMLNTNKTLTTMLDGQKQGRSVDMVNYIGREVEIKGGRFKLDGVEPGKGAFKLASAAANTTLEVRDSAGTVIHTRDLGSLNPGEHNVEWDGMRKDGTKATGGVFNFAIVAKGMNNEDVVVDISSHAKVTGVDLQDKDGLLHSNFGNIRFSDIKAIGVEGYKNTTAVNPVKPIAQASQAATAPQNGTVPQALTGQPAGQQQASETKSPKAASANINDAVKAQIEKEIAEQNKQAAMLPPAEQVQPAIETQQVTNKPTPPANKTTQPQQAAAY